MVHPSNFFYWPSIYKHSPSNYWCDTLMFYLLTINYVIKLIINLLKINVRKGKNKLVNGRKQNNKLLMMLNKLLLDSPSVSEMSMLFIVLAWQSSTTISWRQNHVCWTWLSQLYPSWLHSRTCCSANLSLSRRSKKA